VGALEEAFLAKSCMTLYPHFELALPTHINCVLLSLLPFHTPDSSAVRITHAFWPLPVQK
jgi:hypothetical protein